MATPFLPATVLRSSGEWPLTSALGLLTRKYSALRSNGSPLSKVMVSALPSLCKRNSVGQGVDAASLISISSPHGADRRETRACSAPIESGGFSWGQRWESLSALIRFWEAG